MQEDMKDYDDFQKAKAKLSKHLIELKNVISLLSVYS